MTAMAYCRQTAELHGHGGFRRELPQHTGIRRTLVRRGTELVGKTKGQQRGSNDGARA
jgi:hypothetical protein